MLGIEDVLLLNKSETAATPHHVLSTCMTSSWLSSPYFRSRQTDPASYNVILDPTEWSIKSYLSLLCNCQRASPTWWSARTIFLDEESPEKTFQTMILAGIISEEGDVS